LPFFKDKALLGQALTQVPQPLQKREINNMKNLGNTTASQAKDNVKDIVFWGNGDLFKLIGKASSKEEDWMKSTKAMEIKGVGCVIQVTTQQNDHVAEAVTFIPAVKIKESIVDEKVVGRELVSI